MSDDAGARQPIAHSRQVTIDALCEHFANDLVTVEEFERRVDGAHAATTVDELKELLRDLPGGDLPAVAAGAPAAVASTRSPKYPVISAAHAKETGFAVAVFGGAARKGYWQPARKNYTLAVFGGAELDFREAAMPPGVTDVHVLTMFGGVTIVVPPGMPVESNGIGIMGGFEHVADTPQAPGEDVPTLRVNGLALMGGVAITVRFPGETPRDARRRIRMEKKERRRQLRGG
jgi:DUF1707 SHOCT-like domain